MIYEFNCCTCGKFKRSVRAKYDKPPRFCSHKCRGCTKKFQWEKLSSEEKFVHIKRLYEDKVVKLDGCWEWKASKDKNGYGLMTTPHGITYRTAHQVSWFLMNGYIPTGKMILHHCDNPVCSNPDHLYLGSAQDNMNDKIDRKRQNYSGLLKGSPKGESHPRSKLSENDVREIKNMIKNGKSQKCIAENYNVTISTIHSIKNGKRWNHIKDN